MRMHWQLIGCSRHVLSQTFRTPKRFTFTILNCRPCYRYTRGLNQKTQTLSALVSMHADCVAAHYHGLRRKLVADLPAAVRRRVLLVLLQGFQRSAAIDAARVMSAWENV